ncbi:hypothetical protein Lal_00036853 [Lupinus albus]|nr:hypothetical protein Lal_00036853 [Lupinus albus]
MFQPTYGMGERFLFGEGAIPTDGQIMGQMIQMSLFDSTFQELPEDANDDVIQQHARTFILRMIGRFLMPDTSGSRVLLMYLTLLEDLSQTCQYIWGSTILAFDRISILAPRPHDNTSQLFPFVTRWSQHLITTDIHGHATNIIRSMLNRLHIDK